MMLSPTMTLHPRRRYTLDHFELQEHCRYERHSYRISCTRFLRTGEEVAIKVPHPEVESDPTLFDRFSARQLRLARGSITPGVMRVFENLDWTWSTW